jgi:hypothetical protein
MFGKLIYDGCIGSLSVVSKRSTLFFVLSRFSGSEGFELRFYRAFFVTMFFS